MSTTPLPVSGLLLGLWLAGGACGCSSDGPGDSGEPDLAPSTGGPRFPSVEAFDEPGPYPTTIEGDLVEGCTVHRPAELGVDGVVHPIVLWGNGTLAVPEVYRELLAHLASHGFVVAAADTSNAGSGEEMISCLEGLLRGQDDPETLLFEQLDGERVGATGHSQGGAGALMTGADDRVRTTAPLQPYIDPIPLGGTFERTSLEGQTGPMLLLSGSADGVASPAEQQQPVFDSANVPVTWAILQGANHFEPLGDAGGFRGPLTAWFRGELMDDATAREPFVDPCTLCDDPDWEVVFNDP